MVLGDISYACIQASPDRAYGARVQSIVGSGGKYGGYGGPSSAGLTHATPTRGGRGSRARALSPAGGDLYTDPAIRKGAQNWPLRATTPYLHIRIRPCTCAHHARDDGAMPSKTLATGGPTRDAYQHSCTVQDSHASCTQKAVPCNTGRAGLVHDVHAWCCLGVNNSRCAPPLPSPNVRPLWVALYRKEMPRPTGGIH